MSNKSKLLITKTIKLFKYKKVNKEHLLKFMFYK